MLAGHKLPARCGLQNSGFNANVVIVAVMIMNAVEIKQQCFVFDFVFWHLCCRLSLNLS